jgi:soluble lytic murein transglycosylase
MSRTRKLSRLQKALIAILAVLLAGAITAGAFLLYDHLMRQSYPLEYDTYILDSSQRSGLDPFLIAAVIRVESSFDPDAVSEKGAVGLMQIMPETAMWIHQKIGMGELDVRKLSEPRLNILLGCSYMQYLEDKYDGIRIDVLAAYNAGGGNVDKWLDKDEYSKDGKTLSAIPFKATQDYVGKVEKAYEIYKKLYQDRLGSD